MSSKPQLVLGASLSTIDNIISSLDIIIVCTSQINLANKLNLLAIVCLSYNMLSLKNNGMFLFLSVLISIPFQVVHIILIELYSVCRSNNSIICF